MCASSPASGRGKNASIHPIALASRRLNRAARQPNSRAMSEDQRYGLARHAILSGPLALDGGGTLAPVEIAYETHGALDARGYNAILICHGLTGDQHVAFAHRSPASRAGGRGWWGRASQSIRPLWP